MSKYVLLEPGDPAPWFHQRSFANPNYAFDSTAGRHVVLCFFGSARSHAVAERIRAAFAHRGFFDDERGCFFGVSIDRADEESKRVADRYPGYRFFWDFDGKISQLYGSLPLEEKAPKLTHFVPQWVILNPALRVVKIIRFTSDLSDLREALQCFDELIENNGQARIETPVPIIFLERVFEPELCRKLIDLYETNGGTESGFMREVNGKTTMITDPAHKRRKDYVIDDDSLIRQLQGRVSRRVVPEIAKVHQFKVTRMERYIVSCYAAEDGGHFRAHRDNTTKGTAHRRFAVSINLNSDFDGGEVSFPEFSKRSFKAPTGGAVVFSCSLLHAVSRVTRGRRFAFLPFLYDDAAAKLREQNNAFLDESVGVYKS